MLTSQQHFVEFICQPLHTAAIFWATSGGARSNRVEARRKWRVLHQISVHDVILGARDKDLDQLIWKVWALLKCKISAWLAYQNRLWTVDRLNRRGWPNQKNCPLCRHADESALHLLMPIGRTWGYCTAATVNMTSWDTCESVAH